MQKNLIISLITGQLVALLPLWDWGDKLTFLTGSICITIVAMIVITYQRFLSAADQREQVCFLRLWYTERNGIPAVE